MGRREITYAALLVFATLAVYARVLDADFVRFDDPRYVSENEVVLQGLSADGTAWAFSTVVNSSWQPLTWLSHMLSVEMFGAASMGHHAVNLLLHLLNSLLLFLVLRAASGDGGPSAVAAGLFALHPTHVESVAWISERKDVLSATFWILAMAAHVAYVRRGGSGWRGAVALCLALGSMAKPMLVTLPIALLLLDYWPLRRLRFDSSAAHAISEKVPLISIAIVFATIAILAQREGGGLSFNATIPFGLRAENALMSYGLYVAKTLWPVGLSVLYPHPNLPGGTPWAAWQALVMATTLGGVTWFCLRAGGYLAMGWLWFLVTLMPAIGLVQVGYHGMADRYLYLPGVGLYVIAAWGGRDLFARWGAGERLRGGMAAATLAACAVLSWGQVRHWHDTITLFEHSLSVAPGAFVLHNNLANALLDAGRTDDAIAHYRRAVEIDPGYAQARRNLEDAERMRDAGGLGEGEGAAPSEADAGAVPMR